MRSFIWDWYYSIASVTDLLSTNCSNAITFLLWSFQMCVTRVVKGFPVFLFTPE